MVDTVRTLAALQSLLADNTTAQISPQDLRDMLVSLTVSHGGLDMDSATTTTISVMDTWYEVGGNWTLTAVSHSNWGSTVEGRLAYGGSITQHIKVLATCTTYAVAGAPQVEYTVGIDGTPITATIMGSVAAGSTLPVALTCSSYAEISAGEYVSLMVRNRTDTNDIVTKYCTMTAEDHIS